MKHKVYTWGFPYLDYPLDVLVSCNCRLKKSRVPEKIQSTMYYPNLTFVNVCMLLIPGRYGYACLAYDCARHMVYMRVSLFWLSPQSISFVWLKLCIHSLVVPNYSFNIASKFTSSCIIACPYAHHPSTVGLSPLEALPIFTLRCLNFPHSEAQLCCRDSPSQSLKVTIPLMGHPPHGIDCEPDSVTGIFPTQRPNSAAGISPTRRIKFAGIVNRTAPTQNTTNLPNHPHAKSNIPELKISTPRRHGQFQTTQMVK